MRLGRLRFPEPLHIGLATLVAVCACMVLAPLALADPECVLFGSGVNTVCGSGGSAIVTADFNEDGILDLAIAQGAKDSILVMLGQGAGGVGNGAFSAPVRYFVGSLVKSLEVGDFNGDGRLDLAMGLATNIGIMLGNGSGSIGNGTFGALTTFTAGTNPQGIAVGDFNEDGIADLAVANAGSNNVSILIGNGTNGIGAGTFGAPVNYSVGVSPLHLVAFDQNGDGILDLAVTNNSVSSNSVSLLLGHGSGGEGDGTFAAATTLPAGANPNGIVAGDFDENGHPDLAIVCGSDSVSVFLNTGPGTFNPRVSHHVATGCRQLVTRDFNGDGILDLAVAAFGTGQVGVLLGSGINHQGNGGFGAPTLFTVSTQPTDLVAGDFVRDGTADLVTLNSSGTITRLQGGCAGTQNAIAVTSPATGDLDLFGTEHTITWTQDVDIASVNVELSLDDGVNWRPLASRLDATSFTWSVTPPASGLARIRVSDSDVPLHTAQTGDFEICSMLDTARTSAGSGSSITYLVVADFNEDGLLDVAYSTGTNVAVLIQQLGPPGPGESVEGFIRGAGRFAAPVLYPVGGGATGIAYGDFDGDGILDLAVGVSSNVVTLNGQGTGSLGNGSFGPPVTAFAAPGGVTTAVAVADVNEDGILDILVAHQTSGVSVALGLGSSGVGDGLFAAPAIYGTQSFPRYITVGDLNRDGIVDIVTSNINSGSISVLLGQGSGGHGDGTFGAAANYTIGAPRQSMIADFNGDGVPDLAVASAAANVGVFLGQASGGVPTGSFAPAILYTTHTGQPQGLGVADFDRDQIADIVTTNYLTGHVSLFRGHGAAGVGDGTFEPDFQWPTSTANILALAVEDFDNDLVPDVLVLDQVTGQAEVLLGMCGVHPVSYNMVSAPTSGAFWLVGSEQTVNWTPGHGLVAVDIDVSRDNGINWQNVAQRVVKPPFVWTVTGPATSHARVRVRDDAAHMNIGQSFAFSIGFVSSVDGPAPGPAALSPAWPNPTSHDTQLELTLPERATVDVAVFDVRGARMRTLANGTLAAGAHLLRWDGTNVRGAALPGGLYFVRARTTGLDALRRVIRIR